MAALPGLRAGRAVRRSGSGRRPVRPTSYVRGERGVRPERRRSTDYALRLLRAGVSVELHQWPGKFHGSQVIASLEV
ncbi:hypothetical protein ABZ958_32640 [Streptomyces sp. NPDC046237]|uniref:hypothetical protein n=1 Tax=Streptomyces sp. NPDC046237 TaxID=3154914 RepID=UPI0033D50551